ncbi:MAG: DMT family transporter [Acidimicrobiia bacterium]
MVVALALLAAAAYAASSVLEQRAASEAPDELSMRPGLLLRLVRRPMWLLGTLVDWAGFGLQAVALGMGSLILVQPLLCTGLLFALPIGAAWDGGRRLGRVDWIAAVALTAGLSVFLIVGDPTAGKDFASSRAWVAAMVVLGPLIVGCTIAAMRTRNTARAVLLALATALVYSLTAVITKAAVTELGEGLHAFFTSWEPYAGVVGAAFALLLNQSAFQAGELQASLPTLTAVEPVVGSVLGVLMLDEALRADGALEWSVVVISGLIALGAVVVLSWSAGRNESELAGT